MTDEIEHIDQTEEDEAAESRTSRPVFLKRLGATLAAAVGVAAVLASSARAAPGQCCYDCSCGNCTFGSPPQNGCRCFCDCSGIGKSYCWDAQCSTGGCVSCPC